MFDSKFVVTLLALMLSVIAICNFDKKKNIVEGLGMLPSMAMKPVTVARAKNIKEHPFFAVQNFQAQLSPRFTNTDLGANIRYNLPNETNLASRQHDPLMMGSAVREGFETPVKCGAGGAGTPFMADPVMQSGFAAGNFNEVTNEVRSFMDPNTVDQIPVGDMTTVSPTGEMEQTIVYDRMIVANRNSRLRSQGDWIRGDLPICKNETGWFQVSANPVLDLNQGALNALAGPDNAVTQEMTAFMNNTVGTSTVAGMNLSNQQLASIGAGMNDVTVSAFP
jgi:hypothetical protein